MRVYVVNITITQQNIQQTHCFFYSSDQMRHWVQEGVIVPMAMEISAVTPLKLEQSI